jgi:hypothetical protein
MSTKSREVLYGSRIRGAQIRADGAREKAIQAVREAHAAAAEAWSIRMEGYGGPAQPSPTNRAMPQRMPIMTDAAVFAAQCT